MFLIIIGMGMVLSKNMIPLKNEIPYLEISHFQNYFQKIRRIRFAQETSFKKHLFEVNPAKKKWNSPY